MREIRFGVLVDRGDADDGFGDVDVDTRRRNSESGEERIMLVIVVAENEEEDKYRDKCQNQLDCRS